MKVVKITHEGDSLILDVKQALDEIVPLLEHAESGEFYLIEIIDMNEEVFKNLPEFTGF